MKHGYNNKMRWKKKVDRLAAGTLAQRLQEVLNGVQEKSEAT